MSKNLSKRLPPVRRQKRHGHRGNVEALFPARQYRLGGSGTRTRFLFEFAPGEVGGAFLGPVRGGLKTPTLKIADRANHPVGRARCWVNRACCRFPARRELIVLLQGHLPNGWGQQQLFVGLTALDCLRINGGKSTACQIEEVSLSGRMN